MEKVKASINWEDKVIIVEGPESFVQEQIRFFAAHQSKQSVAGPSRYEVPPSSASEIIAEKKPKGHHEIVATLAFFIAQEGHLEFREADIKKLYLQARVRPPKVMAQALRDAKNRFDFLEAGSKPGLYRLSPHGDRTVRFDLPRQPR